MDLPIIRGPRKTTVAIAVTLAVLLGGLVPPAAGAAPKTGVEPSFRLLGLRFKLVATHLGRFFIGAEKKRKKSRVVRVPAVAVTRPVPVQPAADQPAEAPRPPLPAEAARIRVVGSGRYAAEYDGKSQVFTPNRNMTVGYRQGTYYLVEGDKTLATSKTPIKLKPAVWGAVLSLPDYQDPNWNKTVNLNAFRGSIEVVYSPKSKQLWAVNELYLEDYLRGIAEASHDSPEEHLKVMAILARSYIVHHVGNGGRHPGEPFHLKNSRNGNGDDQVYRGYLSELRQPRIAKAAGDTAGAVVTYQGKPVITPYSTRASGRTRSPAEAGWRVNWPWVQSVPDPDTAGMSRLGHGVGLSGHGSRKRAERGAGAAEILGYYFPGTSVGKADTAGKLVRIAIFGVPAE